MYIEYYINTIDEKEIDIKTNIDNITKYGVPYPSIVAPIHYIKFIKKNYPHIKCGTYVDYPLAYEELSRRQDLILDAIKLGITFINIPVPFYSIINRKYDKFRDDIKKNLELCVPQHIELRYMLEYRKFDHPLLCKVCEILVQGGVNIVYPSTGFFLDNINDNLIACAYLKEKTGINTIVNGNVWSSDHMQNMLKIKPYGFSSNNPLNFRLINQNIAN